ncbi:MULTISPECIES: PadR family transcriptional regulator [unclassified Thermosipho (in: thermotogales)]|uniref:PadR family transcriptional regulator n=1 Tax=unclassified Thermosipho (in: thermotogales) TaxID=2676525 RepID=UPI0009869F59|nr:MULTISPECIES: PadR family transcriptional regulator [unclassified Thermosipho (in: thermotogales)]MBT1247602.1 PadR family transcriptional regulator [Thermosipho sp. 1244]OOC46162.1 PadR family transcriptional regulator [Thermosipho sp. 1223]
MKGAGKYRKTFIEPFILLIIAETPLHGYEIANRLSEYGIELTGLGQMGNLYRILSRLENEGFIISKWDSNAQGPSKKVYNITNKGIEQLKLNKKELTKIKNIIEKFITKVSKFELE